MENNENTEENLCSEEEDQTQGNPINDIHELIRQGEALEEESKDSQTKQIHEPRTEPVIHQNVIQNPQSTAPSSSHDFVTTADSGNVDANSRRRKAVPVEVIVDGRQECSAENPKRSRLEGDIPQQTGTSVVHSSGNQASTSWHKTMSYYGNGGYNPYVATGYGAPPPVYGAPGYVPPTVVVHSDGHHHHGHHHHHHHGLLHELGHALTGHHHHHHGHHHGHHHHHHHGHHY